MRGLAAGAWVLGCLSVLTLFGLSVYAICCAYAWAFGGEGEPEGDEGTEGTSSVTAAPCHLPQRGKAMRWEEIEALYPVPGER